MQGAEETGVSSAREKVSAYAAMLFVVLMSGPPKLIARDPLASVRGEVGIGVGVNALVWFLAALWIFNEFNYYALKERRVPQLMPLERLALVFVVSLLPSLYFSVAPLLSLYRILQLGVGFMFAAAWLRRFGPARTLRHMFNAAAVLGIILFAFAIVLPGEVIFAGRLLGGALAPGPTLGVLLLILTLGVDHSTSSNLKRSMLVLAGVLIVASRTRSILIAALLVVLVAALRSSNRSSARRVVLFLVGLVPGLMLVGLGDGLFAFLARDANSLRTLSERIPLWTTILREVWVQSPLFGTGHMMSRLLTLSVNPGIGSAHSLYVEVFVGAGLVGLTGLAILMIPLVWSIAHRFFSGVADSESFVLMACLTTLLVISLVSEEALYSGVANFALVFLPFWAGSLSLSNPAPDSP